MQVLAFALEKFMFFAVQYHVQVAGRPAVNSRFPFTRVQHALAVFHTRGDFHCHGTLAAHPGLSLALNARIDNQLARSLARAARLRDREESLLVAYLSLAAAGGAGNRRLAWSSAAALA